MRVFTSIAELRSYLAGRPRPRVLVPTMGALHRGHFALMQRAREQARGGDVVTSIFVNPLQFAPGGDYDRYPRNDAADEQTCRDAGVNVVFRPEVSEMYAADRSVFVDETALANVLEGASRPGHFRGVCTVVTKLFNIVAPDAAVFGEKDFQQLAIIRRMVRDLSLPVEIIGHPTVREPDGLACSSRNQYLNDEEHREAVVLHQALTEAKALGRISAAEIVTRATQIIAAAPLARIDYVAVVDADTLEPVELVRENTLIALAVYFGATRLIDNMRLA